MSEGRLEEKVERHRQIPHAANSTIIHNEPKGMIHIGRTEQKKRKTEQVENINRLVYEQYS